MAKNWKQLVSSSTPTVVVVQVVPLWCDLGFFPNSRGNKAAANLRPSISRVAARFPKVSKWHPVAIAADLETLCVYGGHPKLLSCAKVLPQEFCHWFCSENRWLSSGIAFLSDCHMTGRATQISPDQQILKGLSALKCLNKLCGIWILFWSFEEVEIEASEVTISILKP